MKVALNTLSFKSTQIADNQNVSAPIQNQSKVEDSSVQSNLKVKEKTPFKEKIANIWKFFAAADQLTKSYFKGILYGIGTGIAALGFAWVFRVLPKVFAKDGPKFITAVKHPLKYMGKTGKVIAAISAMAVFAGNAIAGHLQTNQRTAVIDHKLKVDHRANY